MTDVSLSKIQMPTSAADVSAAICAAKGKGQITSSRHTSAADRLDLQQMSAVVDYPARDMTITVQAGMPIGRLRQVLAEEQQQLPIDCHDPDITIGAIVASNTAGSRQYGYGTLRDYLIGLEAVDGQGRIFHAGGRVVKNVAGYDLCRLMIGSRGSLGVLTQLTFKVKPVPEIQQGLRISFADAAAFDDALERLNVSNATPMVIDFSCQPDSRTLWLAVEGSLKTCAWQIRQLQSDCGAAPSTRHDSVSDDADAAEQQQPHEWRVRCLPSQLTAITSGLLNLGISSRGHAGSGILFAKTNPADTAQTTAASDFLAHSDAQLVDWKEHHPGRAADALSVRLRQAFDPHSLFPA